MAGLEPELGVDGSAVISGGEEVVADVIVTKVLESSLEEASGNALLPRIG